MTSDLFRHLRIHTSYRVETILCERCQVALNKTELMHVYRCPVCLTVTEQFPKDQTIVESDGENWYLTFMNKNKKAKLKKVIKGLSKASKTHAAQAKSLKSLVNGKKKKRS